MIFDTACACCGMPMIISGLEKERLERKGKPPLCFDHRNRPFIPLDGVHWRFEPNFLSDETVQLRLPIVTP